MVAWLYIVVRYWREIVTGWKQGWHRTKTYLVRFEFARETNDQLRVVNIQWTPYDGC